jgi:surface protein
MQLVFTTTADNQNIELPLNGTVNCTVDWGDGSATEDFTTTGLKPHTFATAGTYTVSISGGLTHFGKTDESTWPGAAYLTEVPSFGNIGLTSLQSAFYDADNLTSVPAELPATVTDLSHSFHAISQTAITNLSSWDVSNVTTMQDMFHGANAFNQDISGWDVSNVENMEGMFDKAELFNANIGTWNVSSVSNMAGMFQGAESFNQNIGNWNVSNVENMMLMFGFDDGAVSNFNQDISTKIVNAGQPDQYTAWDVSGVTNMMAMFGANQSFNQDISNWDVGSVQFMTYMFYYATAFDQNIGNWDITSVTDMSDMFTDGGLSTANYDAILTGWAGKTLQEDVVFSAGATKYSAGAPASARQYIISTYNWDIDDGGMVTTYTWNGSESSAWNTAANWDLNAVPTADADVVIANAGTAPVITSSNQITCAALTVNPGASLTINDRGSLITNSATGTVTVKRMLTGSPQYHLLSSPVNNADLATIFDEGYQMEIYLRRFDEPSGNWVNLEIPANLSNGTGYSYVRQSKAIGTTATFTGSLITSDLTPSLTNNGTGGIDYAGWNLLGNPYTSAVQWGTGTWNLNNVDGAVYVYSNGVYKSYAGGAGTLTNGIIPAQQGFFVKANGASPSITIPTDARVHNSQSFYKNSVPNVLRLDVAGNVNEYVDGTFIRFTPEATPLFDSRFDAYKLNNDPAAPMIYTHAGDATLSINSLPAIEDCNEVAVSFTAGVDGRYTITASGMETFANGNITLTDLATNATQNLSQNPVYSFDATTTDQPDRFKVSFATVGVDENPLQNIGVYATNGQIVLQLPQVTKATVTITNLAGQLVARHNINASGVATLDAPVTTGVYMVTITTGAATITRKVIVK